MAVSKILVGLVAVFLAACSGTRGKLRLQTATEMLASRDLTETLDGRYGKQFLEFSGENDMLEYFGILVRPRKRRQLKEIFGTRKSMELRRKLNKNKARNTSYRVAKKIEADIKIFEQDNNFGSNIVKAADQKQNMIMINGRRAFVNKRKRQLKTKNISSGDKARNLSTLSSPKQGIRADMQESDLSKDQDVNKRQNALIKLEKAMKELKMRETEQTKEAMRKHENAKMKNLKMNPILSENMKHAIFLDKKKTTSSKECEREKEKDGKPNKLHIPTSQKSNGVSANPEIVKKNPNSKFFIQIILPKPVYMKPKATTEIITN